MVYAAATRHNLTHLEDARIRRAQRRLARITINTAVLISAIALFAAGHALSRYQLRTNTCYVSR